MVARVRDELLTRRANTAFAQMILILFFVVDVFLLVP